MKQPCHSPGRMLLVEAHEEELKSLVGSPDDWVLSKEQSVRLPSPHPNLDAPEPEPPS